MIDCKEIINRYYREGTPLHRTLWLHSCAVAAKAVEIIRLRGIEADPVFTVEAALLHDIGIFLCDAPSIHCTGTLPYICHGPAGAALLRSLGMERHALVCERHTGSGLTAEEIAAAALPLPKRDMLPLSIEEKLVCYADKFFSKSDASLTQEKPLAKVMAQMEAHGEDPLRRFIELRNIFEG